MSRQMNILLVEDNSLDAMVIRRSLKTLAPAAIVVHATDGLDALERLGSEALSAELPRPYFILLDINMPRMNGHEFLTELRKAERDADSVVFMYTTSDSPQDIERAYHAGANGYIVKPQGTGGVTDVLRSLQGFWDICEPPSATAN